MVAPVFSFSATAEKCRRRLDDYARAGITTTALQFSSFARDAGRAPREGIARAIERLAAV